jgi:demethylmenaquinone methyltransferase/2-methoxy-6-polyprenyl-1,4-benzoquinol methylase
LATTDRQTTRANYDRLSRWYDLLSASSERAARTRGLQMLGVQCGERVLEIGCGTGESLPSLASGAGPAGWVYGLDLSAGMLGIAKNKLEKHSSSNVTLLQADAVRLPFPERSFDAIFMSYTLELFPAAEIPLILQECKRILRPEGRMGIVALLQEEKPGWMERAYNWAHRHWPLIIDCQPIPLFSALQKSIFVTCETDKQSLWGLTVGIAIAHPE